MADTRPQGFLALPPSGEGPGVLVLHAWWGLNDTIKALCNRLAASGFIAFAPDLYHGQVADTIAGAETLMQALNQNHQRAGAEIVAATRFLDRRAAAPGDGLAVIGFSLGAAYALDLAAAEPDYIHSVVLFYGVGEAAFAGSRATYLGHFAGNDDYEPPENVAWLEQSLEDAGRPVTFYQYEGAGHWFFEPDRPDAYDREAATLAWDRTLAFLREATR